MLRFYFDMQYVSPPHLYHKEMRSNSIYSLIQRLILEHIIDTAFLSISVSSHLFL